MTKRKHPPQGYETFPSNASEQDETSPDKTRSAADEARRLASQGSWADNLMSGRTPTALTPTTSTEDGSEEMYTDRNPYSDPPPMYTPSATESNAPSSPATIRAVPDQVREVPPEPMQSVAEEQNTSHRESTPLIEQANTPRWAHHSKKHRLHGLHRLKKACWFTFALVLCLWLMIPAIIRHHNARTHGPPRHHYPSDPLEGSPIPSWPHPHREYRRHETSNSIHGTFQLYDLLDLSTTSGSISITVNPQEGNRPAVLRLSSSSGSISIRMNTGVQGDCMNRTIMNEIRSNSGSVSGSLIHGNGGVTEIKTKSASMSVDINTIGVSDDDKPSQIFTSSNSGSQSIRVRSPGYEKVKAIQGSHIAYGSAGLQIDYPRTWEGKVHLKSSGSGSVQARGSGLEQECEGREVYAWRGRKHLQEVEVLGKGSGSIQFQC